VAKGSFVNKIILVPLALLISAFIPWAITPLLMVHQQRRDRPGNKGADQQGQRHEDDFIDERPFRHTPMPNR
jgi:hypothetical protein